MTMNERIEQAAREICGKDVVDCDNDCTNCVNQFQLESLIEMANKALSHQWISVDEELPPIDEKCKNLSKDVIVRNEYGKVTTAWYSYSGHNWHLCYGEINGDDLI